MRKHASVGLLLVLINLATLLLPSLGCPYFPTPTSPPPPPPKTTPPPPPPSVPSPPPPTSSCPIDTLKLDACVDLLGGLVHVIIGGDVRSECCPVLEGIADLDAALCLCTTIKAKALGINLLLPIALQVLVDCGKHVPSDYQCPAY
ncbi:36.4 kDa proline-rich protein-like [Curcuma longa]|uniref:36.4 kDa proline-rich protein-like n=1 Tax=Curcuma longa TaxID=136217 RepID=UPI003D9F5DA1